jgi:hypothetical protein
MEFYFFMRFKEGREDVQDGPGSGQPQPQGQMQMWCTHIEEWVLLGSADKVMEICS